MDAPSRDNIWVVVQNCGCEEDEAVELLRRSRNDTKRAIRLYNLQSKYQRRLSPSPARPSTPGGRHSGVMTPLSNADPIELDDERGGTPDPANEGNHPYDEPHPTEVVTHGTQRPEIMKPQFGNLPKSPDLGIAPNLGALKVSNGSLDELHEEWDFVLPVIPLPMESFRVNPEEAPDAFDLRHFIAIMQNGGNHKAIQDYLRRFDEATVRESINDDVEGFPAMFYVVETNKEDILRTCVAYGGNPSAIHKGSGVPLLAFAIMLSDNIKADTTPMTATLLSLGASSDVIPSAFYSPYIQDLPENGPRDENLKDLGDLNKNWCKSTARKKLARTSTLSQRYYLDRAAKTKKPSRRETQVAQRMKAEPLLGLSNFLIGQTIAAKALLSTLIAHLTEPGKKPLVLVFAGPSGHGKTELARRLGTLLSLELEVVDCTIVNKEIDLFGPRHPYVGAADGTALNNFLAKHHGERSIVFLDEFEKTTAELHKTLLLPFESGDYQDRRNLAKIDCSKTIWILATNAHDPVIQEFCLSNEAKLFSDDEVESKRLLKQLSHKIRADFQAHHGPPITGRISEFLPFLPFSKGEQAVIVHKSLLELMRKVQRPVNLTKGPDEQLLGNIRLRISRRDASVCKLLAESEYHADLGARSLIAAAGKVKKLLVEEYLSIDEEITEGGSMSEFIIDANGDEVVVNKVPERNTMRVMQNQ